MPSGAGRLATSPAERTSHPRGPKLGHDAPVNRVATSFGPLLLLGLAACRVADVGDDELGASESESTSASESEATSADASSDASELATEESGSESGEPIAYTYWRDAKSILDRKCMTCHQQGAIGPFALETYDQALEFAPLLAGAIESGTMPPWPPNASCNEYGGSRALSDEEREVLLGWIDLGAPEGDPADAPAPPEPPAAFEPDVEIALPEPYLPTGSPDDYRCFTIDWPAALTEDMYVVAEQVSPDQSAMVHHVIIFVAGPDEAGFYQGLDDADPEPGYECFGGPGKLDWSARWLGAWVPGMDRLVMPPDTGVRVEAGSKLIVQMHYNTSAVSEPVADQSSIGFALAEAVAKPAEFIPILDYGWVLGSKSMPIPAGDPEVMHEVTLERSDPILLYLMQGLGVSPSTTVDIWSAALHQHLLGTHSTLTVERGDAADECLLQVDDWDFHWQGQYELAEPVAFGSGDAIHLQCWWDNSDANQPLVDGVPKQPTDTDWGEGTFDEMCLGVLLMARQ